MQRTIHILVCAVATLVALGTVMIFAILSRRGTDLSVGAYYLAKQLLWAALGFGVMWLAARLDYGLLHRWWGLVTVLGFACLAAVLLPSLGTSMYGSRRWLRFGPVGFQPSEMAKPAMIVTLAALAVRFEGRERPTWKHVAYMIGVVGATAVLVLAEPDLSTAALLGMTGMIVIVAAEVPLVPVIGASLFGASALAFALSRSASRMARIKAFLEPTAYLDGPGYQPYQSLVALGSGGLFGRSGLPKPYFLPQADTDFIFANLGEEFGLAGALGVVFIFLLIVRQGFRIAERTGDTFGRLLAFGITTWLALQALMHIAVVTVTMPTTGIALPFVSSGGSALLVAMASVGILVNIARRAEARPGGEARAAPGGLGSQRFARAVDLHKADAVGG
jgi:cell division protein FtsW